MSSATPQTDTGGGEEAPQDTSNNVGVDGEGFVKEENEEKELTKNVTWLLSALLNILNDSEI